MGVSLFTQNGVARYLEFFTWNRTVVACFWFLKWDYLALFRAQNLFGSIVRINIKARSVHKF